MLGLMSEARNTTEIRSSSCSLVARISDGTWVPLMSAYAAACGRRSVNTASASSAPADSA